jgi:hypothetical protein
MAPPECRFPAHITAGLAKSQHKRSLWSRHPRDEPLVRNTVARDLSSIEKLRKGESGPCPGTHSPTAPFVPRLARRFSRPSPCRQLFSLFSSRSAMALDPSRTSHGGNRLIASAADSAQANQNSRKINHDPRRKTFKKWYGPGTAAGDGGVRRRLPSHRSSARWN